MFEIFHVNSIDYSTFDYGQFICSGSHDKTVRVWNIETNKQIQSFNGHLNYVYSVKFSPYHYYNHCCNIICSSSYDGITSKVIDNCKYSSVKHGLNKLGNTILCGSWDCSVRLWNIRSNKKELHAINGSDKIIE
ncbi:G-protein beta WD-40 repeats containing protein [Reticulomyxa filosa]|uniref:G-protein beta WD-40 repeats containing protein n=1 Tax=Reticulomyxa filosa TaxID=46433 RepID=X6PAU0_RETFI|nr:G-protein beta WD-40 repeats containing protein [Reticulomyxa filosa]|eukprot:ETO35184.1 G-protein beta WD-40 repeats containing protein [Reticulomyxa filosa]